MTEPSTLIEIKGIVALVTGAGSGLGRGTVHRLINLGAKAVIAFDLKFTDNFPDNVIAVVGNVTNEDDVKCALEQCKTLFGRLDAVINCAGISPTKRIYNDSSKDVHSIHEFRNIIEVNTIGTFNVNRLSIALMSDNEAVNGLRGVIITTASIQAFDGKIGQVAYSASKAAIVGMTLPIARDLAHLGIRCVTISPGAFQTPMFESWQQIAKPDLSQLLPICPNRLGKIEEFAHLVQKIIENPMINGEVIRLDGASRLQP